MTKVIIPTITDLIPSPRPGPASLAWLEASPAFRKGRAQIREVMGASLESTGHPREADAHFRMASAIRRGDTAGRWSTAVAKSHFDPEPVYPAIQSKLGMP